MQKLDILAFGAHPDDVELSPYDRSGETNECPGLFCHGKPENPGRGYTEAICGR